MDNFGVERLRAGSGVLDIAGGKGELAWELVNLNLIPSVVLEPRLLELQSVERKWQNGIFWRNPIFHSHLHCAHDGSIPPQTPQHLRLLLTSALISWLCPEPCVDSETDDKAENLRAFSDSCRRAADLRWTRKGLRVHEDEINGEEPGDDELEDLEVPQECDKILQNSNDASLEETADAVLRFRIVAAGVLHFKIFNGNTIMIQCYMWSTST